MENFCLYNGKKIVKPEIWNITSIELSSDYTSAIIQAESKSNKSEYTLDVTPLISNQYEGGLDPYSATIVNELTGVSDWILDSGNNQIVYTEESTSLNGRPYLWLQPQIYTDESREDLYFENKFMTADEACLATNESSYGVFHHSELSSNGIQLTAGCYYTNSQNQTLLRAYVNQVENKFYKQEEKETKSLPLLNVVAQVISNAQGGDSSAQQAVIFTFNKITDSILTSDYSEFFEANKQPK